MKKLGKSSILRLVIMLMIVGLVGVFYATGKSTSVKKVSLTQITTDINQKKASNAQLDDNTRTITLTLKKVNGKVQKEESGYPLFGGQDLVDKLSKAGIETKATPEAGGSGIVGLLIGLAPFLFIGALILFSLRKQGVVKNFGKGRGEEVEVPTTRFKDVAGCPEAVEELTEVVEYLKNPEKFQKAGARVPHGFLLEGPPGTGKTLLARAVAGEAGVPFFAVTGSDFVETYVGVGASRARALFDKAKKAGKSIIFIDEVDAIGRARSSGAMHGATQEHENTLIQLLSEMDGFNQNNIIVIAATNRSDVLDAALTRPGRLDRKITIPTPDRTGREQILRLYLQNKKIAPTVDLAELARRTPGMSGADLAFLMNEAALEASRYNRDTINSDDIQSALATSMLGRERRSAVITPRDQEITAWHEAGHTIAALLLKEADNPLSVTIVPRGPAGGVTWMEGNDFAYMTKKQADAKLIVAMAGRSAECMLLNGDYTQGVAGDLKSATELATQMIASYGMGDDLIALDGERLSIGNTLDRINDEVSNMLQKALVKANTLLKENKDLLLAIVKDLLDKETLTFDDIIQIKNSLAPKTLTS